MLWIDVKGQKKRLQKDDVNLFHFLISQKYIRNEKNNSCIRFGPKKETLKNAGDKG